MGIDGPLLWYQQKIASYDKQQWETRMEQRERTMLSLDHVHMRTTKPNTDLIDLDLVRGSSFTKAKPQHGFLTIAKLATLRHVLLPLYAAWWIQQTSKSIFLLVLALYLTQLVPLLVFTLYDFPQNLSSMELIIPIIMMWMLSLIHSQIVATNHGLEGKKSDGPSKKYRRRRHNFRKPKQDAISDNSMSSAKSKKLKFADTVHVSDGQKRKHRSRPNLVLDTRVHEDDGFESLNGNGSRTSEEEVPVFKQANKSDLNSAEPLNDTCSNSTSCAKCQTWVQSVSGAYPPRVVSTDSESDKESDCKLKAKPQGKRKNARIPTISINQALDTEEEVLSSPGALSANLKEEMLLSSNEWTAITTNSEDCTITDTDTDDGADVHSADIGLDHDSDLAPTGILNPASVKVSCVMWENRELKKADLSMLDISAAIIRRVDTMPKSKDYFYVGLVSSTFLAFLPLICMFCNVNTESSSTNASQTVVDVLKNITEQVHSNNAFEVYKNVGTEMFHNLISATNEISLLERSILTIALFQRWILGGMLFFLLSVAERTFKQRFLYAKLFSHLTSSRRARKSELPHFRLNKVQNIKTWLSVRSYLKKRGPQRSVDVIVSTSFAVCLLLLIFLCFELLKETINFSQYYLEALTWCLGLGFFLLRFMTLGTKINKKYRNLSVLITEQINLHLQIEQKPHKKEELNVANNVLKLAIDLLKELESPFKISGLSANPILYNVTKLIILSALSGVLSEMLGFKLKLHKIKLK